jgi:hypothetical protein
MRRARSLRLVVVLLLLSVALLALQQSVASQSVLPADVLGDRCPPLPQNLGALDASGSWAIRPRLGNATPSTYSAQGARNYVERHGA